MLLYIFKLTPEIQYIPKDAKLNHRLKNYRHFSLTPFISSQFIDMQDNSQTRQFIDKTIHRQDNSQTRQFINNTIIDKTIHRQDNSQTRQFIDMITQRIIYMICQ